MSSASLKTPPKFEDETQYEKWKKDIEIWVILTELDKKKQALAIHLSLSGKSCEISSELLVSVLNSDDGVAKLLERLDKAFLLDKNHRAFIAYQKFERFRQPKEMSIQNYITKFEGLYFKFKQHNMNLPDAVLAFRLLESCSLKDLHFQLAMSTIGDITFDNMKEILHRMFTNGSAIDDGSVGSSTDGADSKDFKVKLEPVL